MEIKTPVKKCKSQEKYKENISTANVVRDNILIVTRRSYRVVRKTWVQHGN